MKKCKEDMEATKGNSAGETALLRILMESGGSLLNKGRLPIHSITP